MKTQRMLIGVLVTSLACAVAAGEDETPLTLEQALAAAHGENPGLRAARLGLAVGQAEVDIAREWPNPDVRYERERETPRDALGLSQPLPLSGKRSRRIGAAQAAARAGEAEVQQAEAEVEAQVRLAFFRLSASQRRAEVLDEVQKLAERARAAASARYDAGDVSRLDVLEAEVALSRAQNEAEAEAGARRAAAAALLAAIGRDPAGEIAVAADIDRLSVPDAEVALEGASANTAVVLVERQIAEAMARASLARAEEWPDPTFEATLTHGAEPEFTWGWRYAFSLAVPLWTQHRAAVHKEQATVAVLRAQREALLLRIRAAVTAAAANAAAQRQRYRRYRDEILPRSREVESMAEEAYRAGQTALPAFLQALQAARDVRGEALQAAVEYESAVADLQQALTVAPK